MFNAVASRITQIMLLKAGPQDLPTSPNLLQLATAEAKVQRFQNKLKQFKAGGHILHSLALPALFQPRSLLA